MTKMQALLYMRVLFLLLVLGAQGLAPHQTVMQTMGATVRGGTTGIVTTPIPAQSYLKAEGQRVLRGVSSLVRLRVLKMKHWRIHCT